MNDTYDCFVEADFTRLKQILINLLSNAVKYNRPHGSVTLTCERREHLLHISVSDTGIGINAQKLGMLFEPFNRLGAEHSSIEGAGVGLALTRKLALLMHTDISVKSVEGEGSEFYFDLPLLSMELPTTPDTSTTPAQSAASTAKKFKVLYVEDNPESQRLMQELFVELADIDLYCVGTAEAGFEVACSEQPHLILLDCDLPDINGLQLGRMLRNNPLTGSIPLLAVSAEIGRASCRERV